MSETQLARPSTIRRAIEAKSRELDLCNSEIEKLGNTYTRHKLKKMKSKASSIQKEIMKLENVLDEAKKQRRERCV